VTRRLVIITEIISPYRIPLFNALEQHPEIDLHVIFLAETDPELRQWQVYREEIRFSYEVLPSWRKQIGSYNLLLNRNVARALAGARPEVVICGGYNYPASWRALRWARSRGIRFFLWSESTRQDLRAGSALIEFAKAEFLRRCDGFVVPGKSAREYLLAHKIKDAAIFTAVNAVDNALFATAAVAARQNAIHLRSALGLPNRYFLFAGRLVKEKGVFDLLSAYAKLSEPVRSDVGLVFVGDGAARPALEAESEKVFPGTIRFPGFAQREQLANYYALADMLILPTYTDTWGLVVNEAMACGLGVVVSDAAGCAADLVSDHWNGRLIRPGDVSSLASVMEDLAHQPELCATFGSNSRERIAEYSPKHWSTGIVRAVEAAGVSHD